MSKKKDPIVAQCPWAFVKYRENQDSYDVWRWNIFKMKWVRLSNSACGFGEIDHAYKCALEISQEIQSALDNNKRPPSLPN